MQGFASTRPVLEFTKQTASYLQEEAAFIHSGAQRKALFPLIRVGGCRAADVLPGGLVVVHCGT